MNKKVLYITFTLLLLLNLVNLSDAVIIFDNTTVNVTVNPNEVLSLNYTLKLYNGTGGIQIIPMSKYFHTAVFPKYSLGIPVNDTYETPIFVNFTIPESFPPGVYKNSIVITYNGEPNITKTLNINVNSTPQVRISPNNLSFNTSMGDEGCLELQLNNTGNQNFNLTMTNDSIFWFYPKQVWSYRGLITPLTLCYRIPINSSNIFSSFNIGGQDRLNITVKTYDNITPQILGTTFPKVQTIFSEFKVTSNVSDNIGIDGVQVNINGEDIDMKYNSKSDLYECKYIINKTGMIGIKFNVTDDNGNSKLQEDEIESLCYMPSVSYDYIIKPQLKVGDEARFSIMNISVENIPIKLAYNLSMSGEYSNATNCSVNFKSDGNTFSEKVYKNLDVRVLCDGNIEYDLYISITFPDWVCNISNKQFHYKGKFGQYSVCKAFEERVLDKDVIVRPYDTGDYETSYCEVISRMPIDTKESDIDFGFNKQVLFNWETEKNNTINNLENTVSTQQFWYWVVFIVAIIILGLLLFNHFIWPHVR